MMLFLPLLATTLALALAAYLLGLATLHLLRFHLGQEEVFLRLFLKLLVGSCLLAVGYALVKTGFETILLPVPVFLYLVFRQAELGRSAISTELRPSKWPIIRAELSLLLLAGLPLFLFRWWLYYDAGSPYLSVPFQDYIYYARLAGVHNAYGIESSVLASGLQAAMYAQPYHYFDLWVNALLVYITGLPSVWTLCISTYAFFMLVASLGIGAVIRVFKVSYGWTLLTSLLVLAITGINLPFFAQWPVTAYGELMAGLNFIMYPKTAPLYLFFGLAVLLLLRKRWMAASWAAACAPLVYITVLPSLAVGLALLTGLLFVFGRLTFKNALYLLVPMVLSGLYIIGFYALHPSLPDVSADLNAAAFKTFLPEGLSVGTLVNIFLGSLINYAAFYVLYLLILLVVAIRWPAFVREYIVVWLSWLCVLVAAACFRAITTRNIDSWQFIFTVIIPLSSVSLAVGFGFALGRLRWLGKGALVGALVLMVGFTNRGVWYDKYDKSRPEGVQRFSPEFLSAVHASLPPARVGGYLFAVSDYLSPYMMNTEAHISGTYLYGLSNDYFSVSLSVLDAAVLRNSNFVRDTAQIDYVVAKSALYQFEAQLPDQGRGQLPDSLKYRFVRQNKLAFICASSAAQLPATLLPLVTKTIVDSCSGEKFYLLHTGKQ